MRDIRIGAFRVHPHMHGDYPALQQRELRDQGSSPYAWGLPRFGRMYQRVGGFIPICMGITSPAGGAGRGSWVHPHMHGDYVLLRYHHTAAPGSSPYAWGLRSESPVDPGNRRFIPICMGITDQHKRLASGNWVHPHMHGDYARSASKTSLLQGSSPYAWGLRVGPARSGALVGFIPICMGITQAIPRLMALNGVHPHMHGDYPAWCPRGNRV